MYIVLALRLFLGLAIAAHGAQKMLGWFGGPGLAGASGFFESLGFRPGRPFAFMAAAGEIVAGLLLILGLGGAIGPALVVMLMIVAIFTVHGRNGFFGQNGGWELNAFYISTAVAIAYLGHGKISLDTLLGLSVLRDPGEVTYALASAVVVAILNLAARRPAKQTA